MTPSPDYDRRNRALAFAARAHRDQVRKGTDEQTDELDPRIGKGVPYIMHPVAVAMILLEHGATDDEILAGILHDVIEDAGVTSELVRQEFGDKVAELVVAESEPDKTLPWRTLKEHTIAHLKSAPHEVKLVAAADKLHNVQSIGLDRATLGEIFWGRFNASREDQAWYYHAISNALLENGESHPLFVRLKATVTEVFGPEPVSA